jgi:hypothetical protein
LDQGFKSVLRGGRKSLKELFVVAGLASGKHHWKEEKWLEQARRFLFEVLKVYRNGEEPSEKEICAMALILYPSKGETKTKKPDRATSKIYRVLDDEGMRMYKTIFDNNNKKDIRAFLADPFIRKLWPHMMQKLPYSNILLNDKIEGKSEQNKMKIIATMHEVTRIIVLEFNLPIPFWWSVCYPEIMQRVRSHHPY